MRGRSITRWRRGGVARAWDDNGMLPDPDRAPVRDVDALRLELVRLRAAVALLATRMPGLSDDDGRILVDLLTPPIGASAPPRPPAEVI